MSENKNENEAPSAGNVQIPKSIATNGTNGGDVEDDLTVGTTTSIAAAATDGAAKPPAPAPIPAPPAKSPYFSAVVNQSNLQPSSNAMPESSPDKEEIIIPGMNASTEEKSGKNTDANAVAEEATKQGGVLASSAFSSHSQRVSLSPPGGMVNEAATGANENSIVIPGVVANTENVNVTQSMMPPEAATKEKTPTVPSTSKPTQRVNKAFTSSSVLGNNSRGIGRFNNGTEKVKFALPESTTKTSFSTKGIANMNTTNTTAITPDHRNGAKQASSTTTPFARPSTSIGKNQHNAVTPTPHHTAQYDSTAVIPGMPTAEKHNKASNSNESRAVANLQHNGHGNEAMATSDSVRSPTPASKNDVSTPKASNLNNNKNSGGGYSGSSSSMLTTHESFDELLSQLGADLTDATDIHNKGNLDLLQLEVALTHAYAKSLQLKGQFVDLVDEIDAVSSMGESIIVDLLEG